MEKTIEFKCPRCGGKAYYYPKTLQAGCPQSGWLLYTEIPQEIRTPSNKACTGRKAVQRVFKKLLKAAFRQ